jgi:hypothetical protein
MRGRLATRCLALANGESEGEQSPVMPTTTHLSGSHARDTARLPLQQRAAGPNVQRLESLGYAAHLL